MSLPSYTYIYTQQDVSTKRRPQNGVALRRILQLWGRDHEYLGTN